jgi:hypothetical protein
MADLRAALNREIEINVGQSRNGRDVVVRYEEGQWWVAVVDGLCETYVRSLWPKARAFRFAKSIMKDKHF